MRLSIRFLINLGAAYCFLCLFLVAHGDESQDNNPAKADTPKPCLSDIELYYGYGPRVYCLNVQTGSARIVRDLVVDNLPEVALTGQFGAVNDQVFYYGWGRGLTQRLVDASVRSNDATLWALQSENGFVRAWNDLVFDHVRDQFWGTFDDAHYQRHFYRFEGPNSSPSFFATASLAACKDSHCGTAGLATQSVIDAASSMYYGIVQGQDTTYILSMNLKTGESQLSPGNPRLAGLKTLSLDPTTGRLYGWLSHQRSDHGTDDDSGDTFLHSTSIVEIDPATAEFSMTAAVALRGGRMVSAADPGSPYLVSFDWLNRRVTGLFREFDDSAPAFHHALKTFDVDTGALLHDVRSEPASGLQRLPWGLAYMAYRK